MLLTIIAQAIANVVLSVALCILLDDNKTTFRRCCDLSCLFCRELNASIQDEHDGEHFDDICLQQRACGSVIISSCIVGVPGPVNVDSA